MIRMRTVEISVGAFVLAGMLALVFLAIQVSGVTFKEDVGSYRLTARFDDVAGLRTRAKVTIAGVAVGRVEDITVDPAMGDAIVMMEIDGVAGVLPLDTGAKILTEGILGARYIGLSLGADEEKLADGDTIEDTQGALVLENLIGNFITRIGAS